MLAMDLSKNRKRIGLAAVLEMSLAPTEPCIRLRFLLYFKGFTSLAL